MIEIKDNNPSDLSRRHPQGNERQTKCYAFPSSPPIAVNHNINLAPQTDIDRFTILRHIDNGSSAAIYLARDNISCKNVAVKVIDAGPCAIDGVGEILRNEKLLYDRIADHSHIIKAYDIHSIKWAGTTLMLLSMEFAEGKTLMQLLDTDNIVNLNWIDCFAQITKAVAALHREGIYHRDIKPDNFIMTGDKWKLCDLGQASVSTGTKKSEYKKHDIRRLGDVFYNIIQKSPELVSSELSKIIDKCLGKDGIESYSDIELLLNDIIRINESSDSGRQISTLWEKACGFIGSGHFSDAMEVCNELIEKQPSHQQARAMRDDLRARKNQSEQILRSINSDNSQLTIEQKKQYLNYVDTIYPNFPGRSDILVRINSSNNLFDNMIQSVKNSVESGHWERAAALIEHAIQLNPDFIPAQNAYQQINSVLEQIQSANQQKNTAMTERDCQTMLIIDNAINEYLKKIRSEILLTLN